MAMQKVYQGTGISVKQFSYITVHYIGNLRLTMQFMGIGILKNLPPNV